MSMTQGTIQDNDELISDPALLEGFSRAELPCGQSQRRHLENAAKQLQERDRRIAELQQYEWRAKREAEQRQRLEKLLEQEQSAHRELLDTYESAIRSSQEKYEQLEQTLHREKEEELAALYQQFITLRERCSQLDSEKELHLFSYEQLQNHYSALQAEDKQLRKAVELLQGENSSLQQQIKRGEQGQSAAAKEAKALEMRCFEILRENGQLSSALAKSSHEREQAQQERDRLKGLLHESQELQQKTFTQLTAELEIARQKESESAEECLALAQQLIDARNTLHSLRSEAEAHLLDQAAAELAINESREMMIRLKGELSDCIEEKNTLEQALHHTALCLEEEKENGYKAQQYLAKKVRENSSLMEEAEDRQKQLELLKEENVQLEQRQRQLGEEVAAFEQRQQRSQEEADSKVSVVQEQCRRQQQQVEELKALLANEREGCRELKKMEEKYNQLIALISSLGLSAPGSLGDEGSGKKISSAAPVLSNGELFAPATGTGTGVNRSSKTTLFD